MSAPQQLVWEDWRVKPGTIIRMVRFTGFDGDGNGHTLLRWLDERGINSVRDDKDPNDILLIAQERDDARAKPGCWFAIGTRGEVYPIDADVQSDKYEDPAALLERLTARFGAELAAEITALIVPRRTA